MATTFTPAPRPLSTDELAAIRCALRSGIEPTLEQALRLLATVDAVQTALTWHVGRVQTFGTDEERAQLAASGPVPGQVVAEVESRHDGRPLNHKAPATPGGRRA